MWTPGIYQHWKAPEQCFSDGFENTDSVLAITTQGFRKATEIGRWQMRAQPQACPPLYSCVCASTTGHLFTSSFDAVRNPFDFFNHIKQSGVTFWNRIFQTLCSVWRWLHSGFPVNSCSQLVIPLELGRKGKQVVLYCGFMLLQLCSWELVNAWV